MRITLAQLQATGLPLEIGPPVQLPVEHEPAKAKSKYRAQPQVTEDGRFDSKKELRRWEKLKQMAAAGQIHGLTRDNKQKTFILHGVNGAIICRYVGDFVYTENGQKVCEDAKGMKTPVYKLKRKLFLDEHGNEWEHRES